MYKIIDSHCHIYPEKIAARATQATGNFYDLKMWQDGTLDTLRREGAKSGINHFIIQSVATTPAQVSSINNFIASEVKKNDNLTGLGTLHPESEHIEQDVNEIISLGLKGVKLHPDIQRFKLDDYRCLKIYEMCEKKLPILIHTGDSRYDYSNPNRLIPILEIYKNLTVIGAHFGGWSIWKEAAKKLYKFPNLYVDSSSSLYALSKNDAREIVDMYGADRILFGTDYPMWSPTEELKRFFDLELSKVDNDKILHENAQKLFDIKL